MLFNLISQQPHIDKTYLYAKVPYEAKLQFLINKRKSTELKHLNDSKDFIEYSNEMNDIYKNIEEYNPNSFLLFSLQSYFAVPKNIRLNSIHYFIMKIPNKREFQQTALNSLRDIDFKNFINLYKKMYCKAILFGKEYQQILNEEFQSYYDLFQVN